MVESTSLVHYSTGRYTIVRDNVNVIDKVMTIENTCTSGLTQYCHLLWTFLWRLRLQRPVSMEEQWMIVVTHSRQCVNFQMMINVLQGVMAYIQDLFRKRKDRGAF